MGSKKKWPSGLIVVTPLNSTFSSVCSYWRPPYYSSLSFSSFAFYAFFHPFLMLEPGLRSSSSSDELSCFGLTFRWSNFFFTFTPDLTKFFLTVLSAVLFRVVRVPLRISTFLFDYLVAGFLPFPGTNNSSSICSILIVFSLKFYSLLS